jgi:hypothetical protein
MLVERIENVARKIVGKLHIVLPRMVKRIPYAL